MKLVRIVTTALVVAAGWLFTTTEAGATPEMSKKEKTGCASCHVSAKDKTLNKTGECYKESKDLKACKK